MAAFMEQIAGSNEWSGSASRGTDCSDHAESSQNTRDERFGAAYLARHRRSVLLNRVVAAEILPRLALMRHDAVEKPASTPQVTTEGDTAELVRLLLLLREDDGATLFIESLRLRGIAAATLYLGVMTDAARILGTMWEDDRCDFAQVTIGLGRLQKLVRILSPTFQAAAVSRPHPDSVLLLPAPGEQHTLGLVVLAEFFRREGWQIAGGPVSSQAATGADAAKAARDTWIDVVGFSIGSASRVDGLTASIRAVRKASRNRDVAVMIGGPLFLLQPDLVGRVGADMGAIDAQAAVRQARGLLAMREAAD